MKEPLKNQNGLALALIIMVFAVVSILGTIGLSVSLSEARQSVSTETYEENYYYARSATDTVSNDIINMVEDVFTKSQILASNPSPSALEVENYNKEKEKVEKILEGGNVVVSGIGKKDIVAVVSSKTNPDGTTSIEIASTYENEGRSSTSKVRLGEITKPAITMTMSGTSSAIHSWGKTYFGKTPVIVDGKYTYGESFEVKGTFEYDKTDMPIYPVDVPSVADDKNDIYKIIDSTTSINKNYNGYHGDVSFTSSLNIETTTAEPVILGFSRMAFKQNEKINVTGNGEVYIFLFEDSKLDYTIPKDEKKPGTPYIFNVGNSFEVVDNNPSETPSVYFIAETINKNSPDLVFNIGNATTIHGYFYLPGVKFVGGNTAASKTDYIGSVWATEISMGNDIKLKYKKPNKAILPMVEGSGVYTVTGEAIKLNKIDVGGGTASRIWVK